MSLDFVCVFFVEKVFDIIVMVLLISLVIVLFVVEVYGVEFGCIVKMLLLCVVDCVILIVVVGILCMDNKKVKV